MFKLTFIVLLTTFGSISLADTLFEGYYKMELEGQHIGYSIVREEFDPKKKEFKTTIFTKVIYGGEEETQATTTRSSDGFKPIALEYTSLDNKNKKKLLTGIVKNDILELTISDGGQPRKYGRKLQPGSFFSSMTVFLMLQKGLKTDARYEYPAIAEETGEVSKGLSVIDKKMMDYSGQKVFKVTTDFTDFRYITLLNAEGETLVTDQPRQNLHAELVKNSNDAIMGKPFPKSVIENLFGSIPLGKKNSLNPDFVEMKSDPAPSSSPKAKTSRATKANAASPKGQHLPPKGIVIKTQTTEIPNAPDLSKDKSGK